MQNQRTSMNDKNKISKITDSGYAFSKVECTGMDNKRKQMLFIEVDKKHLDDLKKIINTIDRNAFMVINETKYVVNGFFKQNLKCRFSLMVKQVTRNDQL